MMFALFKDGLQISKAHIRKDVVITEAMQRGAMVRGSPDFPGDYNTVETVSLADGYEIREVEEDGE